MKYKASNLQIITCWQGCTGLGILYRNIIADVVSVIVINNKLVGEALHLIQNSITYCGCRIIVDQCVVYIETPDGYPSLPLQTFLEKCLTNELALVTLLVYKNNKIFNTLKK